MAKEQDVQEKQGNLKTWTVHHITATCGSCGKGQKEEFGKAAGALALLRVRGWKIVHRRKGKPIEVTCPECIDKAARAKASHQAALAQLRADEHAARDKRRELSRKA